MVAMPAQVIYFDRKFEMWLYAVSHGQLLLRSNRSNELTTRIDVLFKNVASISLPTVFEGLSLAEVTIDEARNLNIQVGSLSIGGRKIFMISGLNFIGYVAAGAVHWHEDEGHHFDESYFQESFSTSE